MRGKTVGRLLHQGRSVKSIAIATFVSFFFSSNVLFFFLYLFLASEVLLVSIIRLRYRSRDRSRRLSTVGITWRSRLLRFLKILRVTVAVTTFRLFIRSTVAVSFAGTVCCSSIYWRFLKSIQIGIHVGVVQQTTSVFVKLMSHFFHFGPR